MRMTSFSVPFIPGEISLLKSINGSHSAYWDAAMWLISNFASWVFPALALLIFLFWKRPKSEAILLLMAIGLCIALGDILSSQLAKPFFARLRPTHTPWLEGDLHSVFGYRGHLYGFFSGHSANYVAVATLLVLTFRNRLFAFLLALLVGWVIYSRIYIGAHFPSDCLTGIIVGLLIGGLVYRLYRALRHNILSTGYHSTGEIFRQGIGFLNAALFLTIPLTLAFALEVMRLMAQ